MKTREPNAVIKSYRDLDVWRESIALSKEIYQVSNNFPKSELYGLTSQIKRAVVSIPSNIAEGNGRIHLAEYIHHLSIARASLCEVETQLVLSVELDFVSRSNVVAAWKRCQVVGKMLTKLIASLARKS